VPQKSFHSSGVPSAALNRVCGLDAPGAVELAGAGTFRPPKREAPGGLLSSGRKMHLYPLETPFSEIPERVKRFFRRAFREAAPRLTGPAWRNESDGWTRVGAGPITTLRSISRTRCLE